MTARVLVLCLMCWLAACSQQRPAPAGTGVSVAEQELRSGSPGLALQMTQSILEHTPDDLTALLVHGDAAAQLGKTGDASTAFIHALRLQPNSVRGQLGLGRLRLATDPTEAATLFGEVVKREPNNVTGWNNLGIARDLLGQHREAQEAYRHVHALDATNAAATVNMALSLAMSGDGADGVALIAPLATASYASAQLRHDYAVVLAMAGRETEAGQILAHDLSPDQVKQALDTIRQQKAGGQ